MQAANGEVPNTEISQYLEDKTETKSVKLKKVIPVELRYETIVLEDGKLHIYKDVYAQDANAEDNLRRVLEANGARLEDLQRISADKRSRLLRNHPKTENGDRGESSERKKVIRRP